MTRSRAQVSFSVALALALAASASQAQETRPQVVEVIAASADVHDLAVMGDRVLVATSGGLLIRRQGATVQTLTTAHGLPGTRLRSVSPISSNQAWVGAIEGAALVSFEPDGPARVARVLPDLRRLRRAASWNGATYFATYGQGLYRLSGEPGSQPERVTIGRHATFGHQTDLLARGEELWVATAGAGVFRLDPQAAVVGRIRHVHGLANDLVWRLEPDGEDSNGNLRTVAATAGGVSVIAGHRVTRGAREAAAIRNHLSLRDTRDVARVGRELWVATYGGGVHRIVPGRSRPQGVAGSAVSRAQALVAAEQGVLMGHEAGLDWVELDGRGRRSVTSSGLPSGDVSALARAFGSVWVGTYSSGLARLQESSSRARAVSRATVRWGVDRRVNHLAVTGRGTASERLWIATDRGLFWHDGRRYVRVEDPAGPGTQHVTCLYVHPTTSELWVASSRQLSRYAPARGWQAWTGDPGLPVVNLHAVSSDGQGRIWVGSLHGLYRFDTEAGRFARHNVSSGALPVDWVTAISPWGARGMVAGTYHGGLSWHDGASFAIERESEAGLPSGWVNPHAMERLGGQLWIGTLERGLLVGERGRWIQVTTEDGLPSDDVTAVLPATTTDSAWVSTRGGLARVSFGQP